MKVSVLTDALNELLSYAPEQTEKRVTFSASRADGYMVTKFMVFNKSVKLVDVHGDCKGVTGYECEEFKGQDIMKLLGLNPKSVEQIFHEVEGKGICNKITYFTQKSGQKVKVWSTVLKVFENTYIEITSLSNSILHL